MTVYVDDVRHDYHGRANAVGMGRMVMCHMFADTLEELLAMADRIGVQRKWLQQPPKASWVHFDVALSKKKLAIAAGAVLLAKRDIASGDQERMAYGQAKLNQIARCRALTKNGDGA